MFCQCLVNYTKNMKIWLTFVRFNYLRSFKRMKMTPTFGFCWNFLFVTNLHINCLLYRQFNLDVTEPTYRFVLTFFELNMNIVFNTALIDLQLDIWYLLWEISIKTFSLMLTIKYLLIYILPFSIISIYIVDIRIHWLCKDDML